MSTYCVCNQIKVIDEDNNDFLYKSETHFLVELNESRRYIAIYEIKKLVNTELFPESVNEVYSLPIRIFYNYKYYHLYKESFYNETPDLSFRFISRASFVFVDS